MEHNKELGVSDSWKEFQEMGSQDDGGRALPSTNSFSIRNYVIETREQDIRNNWPFPDKYLEVCMNHGVNRLLPPFKSLDYEKYASHEEQGESSCAQEDNTHIGFNNKSSVEIDRENELIQAGNSLSIDDAVSELTKQMSPLSLSTDKHSINTEFHQDLCDYAMPSTISRKRKKHKRKLKKRSLADIYAEASPHTLEDLADIGAPTVMRYVCAQGTTEGRRIVHEIQGSMQIVEQNNAQISEESFKLKYLQGNEEESFLQGGDPEAHNSRAISWNKSK